ncbi:uncharacterized protein LOC114975839 isoform X2 [Acropora millepora]|uniref:uncharacterized protein LOC114975839 isoform X2 n=1 Tax=Acropora millepora TaxID=45264 RepID=UPI001CF0E2DD|nr:uncharacterized protein LOC114975839 isoform X2 [Acropora millepora]
MTTVVESSTSFTISTVPGGEALGVENGSIPDENITASSSAGPAPAHLARLNGPFAWCVAKAEDCYLQIDLGSLHLVCAVATQGNPGGNRDYVRRYKLQCSADGVNWTLYEENGNTIIAGNTDNWSVKRKDLDQEVVTRFVRFCPVDWYCWPCMRVELYGAPLNINEKIAELQSQEGGGGFVLDRVLVTTQETDGHSSQGEEAISLKKNETMPSETISEDAKEYEYQVHIYTGYEWGAGTDANILITLFGEDGDSEETKLDNNKNNFERGQKDSFVISCGKYLGRLSKIRIGHDNTGFGAAWFLDKVTVEDPKTGVEVIFSCQRWFSTSDDDGKISRELIRDDKEDATIIVSKDKVLETAIEGTENVDPGQNVGTLKENGTTSGEVVQEEVKDYLYQVHVYTGDKWGAGTDANVLITIFGEDGDSGEKKLDNNKNNFESGQKDSFVISCEKYLGRVSKIRIGHDNSGFGAAWFLDKVTIEDPKTGEITFSCQRWFSSSDDDGKISRELVRDDKDEETIIVSQKKVLETAIEVRENVDPGQNVETLKENATTSGEVVQEEVKDYQYQVHIYTGDKWGAGTDANVLITIFGENGDSGEKKLDNNRNNFESGQKDSFSVSCGAYLGRLSKIRIGHDNTGFGAAWFLDKVTVEDSKTGEEVTFSCQRWFSTSDGDGKISRELVRDGEDEEATVVSQEKILKTNIEVSENVDQDQTEEREKETVQIEVAQEEVKDYKYQVHIYTGDKWGAGTDANVLITLFGEDGDSEEKKLDNNKNNFESGQKDSFVICCGTYLGQLSKIRIGHDNTGFGAAWFLDKVTVEDPKTGEEVIFPCQRWFSTNDGDGKISRELVRDDKVEVEINVSQDFGTDGQSAEVRATEEKLDNDGEPDRDKNSLKEKENGIIKDTKEERKQKQEHDEIESIIEKQEVKRKEADRDEGVMDEEQSKALASIQLVLEEEKKIERREKPDGQADETIKYSEVVVEKNINPATKEYSRIEEEHRKRMQEIEALLGEHEERRKKEKDEKAKLENDATRRKEEDRRRRDEEARKKREEERLKWEEEHKKWEEERKKRDLELQAVLEEGRRKREEDRRKREDELKNIREQERKKREEERKKRMEEETKKLAELRREREERWRKRSDVAVVDVNLTLLQAKKEDEDVKNRFEDKKKKEEGWKMAVDAPRKVEEDMKKFRDEERKRLEEERRKQKEKELADAEAEKAIKSELRAKRLEKGEPRSHVSVATIQLGAPRNVAIAEEKRRIELRVQQIEEERKVREEGEKRQREDAERKKKEDEEKLKKEQERMQKEQEAERAKRKEELRLKREAEERKKQEEEQRQREQERKRRRASLEEKTKRLEEDRKKREEEELIWRREMEERKKQEDEEKKKQMEIKRIKRLSIDRKKFDEDEKKRLDAIERKRIEEEERARLEDEQRRREDRERWKMKQMERRRSGEISRRKSEEDLRNREDRASFKERQRKKRDNKSFEKKWVFMNGESNEVPAKESMSSAVSEPVIFPPHTPETKHGSVTRPQPKTAEPKIPEPKILEPKIPQPKKPEPEKAEPEKREPEKPADKDEEDSRRDSLTVGVNTTITAPTRSRHSSSSYSLPRSTSSQWSLSANGDARPYRAQPRCDHLLPTGPAVQMAEAESFFDKYDEEEEGKLRPFPSWYGSRDMGSLSHLYSPANPITDSDIDELLAIESEDFQSWKRVKKSRELEIYSRKGKGRGKPPVTKATIVLKDVPYREVIDLVTEWGERSKWDKTFDAISFLDQMADFKVLKCSLEKKNRCFVIASLDREDEQPYYAWVWKAANHPSVPGEDSKVTVLKMDTGICGAIIRPYHDATRSSKITIITQVRGSVPSPLKSTYLTGNPSKWLGWLKKHYESQEKNDLKKNENRDSSSSSSSSDN